MSRERQPGRQLEPPGAATALLAAHYYQALLSHAPFAENLRQLYTALDAFSPAGPPTGIDARGLVALGPQAMLAHARAECRWVAQQVAHAETAGRWAKAWAGTREVPELADFAEGAARGWFGLGREHLGQAIQGLAERRQALALATEAVRHAALAVFARRWPLPAGAVEDLAHSFRLWCALGRPNVPLLVPALLVAELFGAAVSPVRLPPLPPAIDWSPVEGRAAFLTQVTELVRRFEAEAREAADARERAALAAGWQELPRRTPDLALRAERLFRRVVLRQSWAKIQYETGATDRALVRRQVVADAALLGIPLP